MYVHSYRCWTLMASRDSQCRLLLSGTHKRELRPTSSLRASSVRCIAGSVLRCGHLSTEPSWRNWLARSTVNRQVGGSIPPEGVWRILFLFWL